jgi:uncharacterized membrane protein YccF (DUF307 family)
MKTLGNIIWLILGGLEMAIVVFCLGISLCCTIVLIPVGIQLFKIGTFTLWPFGKKVKDINLTKFKKVLNVIWAILLGWELALLYCMLGVLYCITIIGIPLGKQWFKLASFIFLPLGRGFGK